MRWRWLCRGWRMPRRGMREARWLSTASRRVKANGRAWTGQGSGYRRGAGRHYRAHQRGKRHAAGEGRSGCARRTDADCRAGADGRRRNCARAGRRGRSSRGALRRGEARVRLNVTGTVETGEVRRRVTRRKPDGIAASLQDAQDFDRPGCQRGAGSRLSGCICPYGGAWRRLRARSCAEQPKRHADARSQAQGAAEKIAKLNCPAGVEILDKWVDYSMIDDEFVYATVVLVFEAPIGARHGARLALRGVGGLLLWQRIRNWPRHPGLCKTCSARGTKTSACWKN